MTVEELERHERSSSRPPVLDVRSTFEYRSGHIPEAIHAPLISLLGKAAALTGDKRQLLVLVCEHGPRAQLGKALLKWSGYKNVELLDGHMASWRQSGCPMHKGN